MKSRRWFVVSAMALIVAVVFSCPAMANDGVLRYSCSAQVHEALLEKGLAEFGKESGIKVEEFIGTSEAAVHRLMNGYSDIAGTVEPLGPRHTDYGYRETPFCKAPLVVITHPTNPVKNLSESQLRDIFAGTINNWKDVGGPDQPIVVVVPGKDTGAFNNFNMLALKRSEIQYDFMTYRSTRVVMVVKNIPWTISFITMGAYVIDAQVKTLDINNIKPTDAGYPYQQVFSYITKGEPCCEAMKLIDFTFSDKGRDIIVKNGMTPLERKK
jgi:phosphate transport system substrate-binding protein